jgi:hypothetical protein
MEDSLKFNFPKFKLPELPNLRFSRIDFDELNKSISESRAADLGFAHVMYDRLMKQIQIFEDGLNSDEEIGAYLSSFGTRVVIQIEGVGYHNPYFIIFYGRNTEDGQEVQLVQHTSQISVLFVAIKVTEDREPRRIGFDTSTEGEKSPEEDA